MARAQGPCGQVHGPSSGTGLGCSPQHLGQGLEGPRVRGTALAVRPERSLQKLFGGWGARP